MSKVELKLSKAGQVFSLEVDGQAVAKVTSLVLHCEAGETPRLVVERVLLGDVLVEVDEANVEVHDRCAYCRQLLAKTERGPSKHGG